MKMLRTKFNSKEMYNKIADDNNNTLNEIEHSEAQIEEMKSEIDEKDKEIANLERGVKRHINAYGKILNEDFILRQSELERLRARK